jgi:hypothetical protein
MSSDSKDSLCLGFSRQELSRETFKSGWLGGFFACGSFVRLSSLAVQAFG